MAANQGTVLLSELDPNKRRVTVCARVARMWDFLGRNNELAHVDVVLVDAKGFSMYAEIGPGHAKKYRELMKEGNVYLFKDFFVQPAKNKFKAVPGQFMMKITPWTKAEPARNVPDDFPLYAYALTDFESLPSLVGAKESFIDVLGIVTGISELLYVRLPGQSNESHKRTLHLVDINGTAMDAAIWGNKATDFPSEDLFKTAQTEVIIILLVGTLIKSYKGRDTISCGEAGKVYINPDIPEKRDYCERLGKQLPAVRWLTSQDDHYYNPLPAADPEIVEVKQLLNTDPNEYLGLRMVCTVTVLQLKSNNWWFMACSKCHKTAYTDDDKFICSDGACPSIQAEPRYKIRVMASDGTGEIELIFFAMVAEQLIGKKADTLARAAARRSNAVPAEITALVTQKYTVNISVSQRGLAYGELAFQVNSVDVVHRKASVFQFAAIASSSNQPAGDNVPPGLSKFLLPDKSTTEAPVEPSENDDNKDITTALTNPDEENENKEADHVDSSTNTELPNDQLNTPPPITSESSSGKSKQTKKRAASDALKPSAAKQLFSKKKD